MRKKMLAILLAVSLFMGLAVPAFAADLPDTLTFSPSAESGDVSEITQLSFKKSSYTVKYGESIDLTKEIIAYCGSNKICQEPDLEWDISESLAFGYSSDGVAEALEESGTATVTVTSYATGKKATCKLVAAKGATSADKAATGFKFEETSYTFYKGAPDDEQTVIKVVPTSTSMYFTSAQMQDLIDNLPQAIFEASKSNYSFVATEGTGDDAGKVILTLQQPLSDEQNETIRISDYQFPRDGASGAYSVTKNLVVRVELGEPARRVISRGTAKVEVGQMIDLYDYLAFSTNANYGKNCSFELTLYNDNAESMDYAALSEEADGRYLQGVAVGKVKVQVWLENDESGNYTTTIPVEVVAKGALTSSASKATITPTTGTIAVGNTIQITMKNAEDPSLISWTINDDSLAELKEDGATATIKGLAAGTVTVIGYYDAEEVDTAKITVTKAADTSSSTSSSGSTGSTGTTPPATGNPQTGDCWFAFLF